MSSNTKKKKDLSEKPITAQQQVFVKHYVTYCNATRAALKAGYSVKGADSMGCQLLRNPKVKAAIDAGLKAKFQRADITAERIILEMFRLATSDLSKAYNDDGSLKHPKEMPEDVRRAISGIDVDYIWEGTGREREKIGETKKLKFFDKNKALEMLGKHFRLMTDSIEVVDKTAIAERLGRAKKNK